MTAILSPFDKQIWQRNYYEHVIRDEDDYQTKWQYIDENPANGLRTNTIIYHMDNSRIHPTLNSHKKSQKQTN